MRAGAQGVPRHGRLVLLEQEDKKEWVYLNTVEHPSIRVIEV